MAKKLLQINNIIPLTTSSTIGVLSISYGFLKVEILNANAAKGANTCAARQCRCDAKEIKKNSRFFALFAQFALKPCHKTSNKSIYFEKALLDLMNKVHPFARYFSKKLQPHKLKADAVFINEVLGY
jgi:hypothetical protein